MIKLVIPIFFALSFVDEQLKAESQSIVQYPEFIVTMIAIIGLIVTAFWILGSKITDINERLAVEVNKNSNDDKSFDVVWRKLDEINIKMESINKQRESDVMLFTETIHKLNLTLVKMEVTLENSNTVMGQLGMRLENQGKEIGELKGQVSKGIVTG